MPKRDPRSGWTPKYCRHQTGQGYVVLGGTWFYLGPHGTEASLREYDRLIAEWRAAYFQAPVRDPARLTVAELTTRFDAWADGWYTKGGRHTAEYYCYGSVIEALQALYPDTLAADFTPPRLKAVRDRFLARVDPRTRRRWTRGYVNEQVNRARRIWAWAVQEGLVPLATLQALQLLRPLVRTKTAAPEGKKVIPVEWAVVEKTLGRVDNPKLAALVRVHRLLGCRAGEVVLLRPCDLDAAADPEGRCWRWQVPSFKTEWQENSPELHYWVGPQAQAVIRPLLDGLAREAYVFGGPRSHARTGTRLPCYTRDTYARGIARACAAAGVGHWSPRQLRHLRATEIRELEHGAGRKGRETAQAVLRHADAETTDRYAELDAIARQAQARLG